MAVVKGMDLAMYEAGSPVILGAHGTDVLIYLAADGILQVGIHGAPTDAPLDEVKQLLAGLSQSFTEFNEQATDENFISNEEN